MAAYVRLREAKKGLEGVIMSAVQCPLSHSPVHLLYLQGCLHCRDPTINCRLTDVAEAESSRQATPSSGTAFLFGEVFSGEEMQDGTFAATQL